MLSHAYVGITDFSRALAFYAPIMEVLGNRPRFSAPENFCAAWQPVNAARPLFLIGRPADGKTATPGNGQMVALLAPTREAVDRSYALAISMGAADEGRPGLRPHYHPHYYGAYFRDPDGNKICVCCHDPVPVS